VTVFEKNDRIGGLLRYGIPTSSWTSRTSTARGADAGRGRGLRTRVLVGGLPGEGLAPRSPTAKETVSAAQLMQTSTPCC
jgi:NADPH-dependent glutamate synthase beta subunit-like oxidoreductase